MAKVLFNYKDNENVSCILDIDYDKLGTNIDGFDFAQYWNDSEYGNYDDMYVNFYVKYDNNYDYTPFANIILKDGTLLSVNASTTHEYSSQYYLPISVGMSNGVLSFKVSGSEWKPLDNMDYIEFSLGHKSQTSSANLPNTFNLVGVYKVTDEIMKTLLQTNNRFQIRSFDVSNTETNYEIINVSKSILRLYKSFIKLNFEEANKNITINGFVLNVLADEKDDLVNVYETENVLIEGFYKNVLDNDSDIIIHLPFYNNYTLDSKYINHNIKFRFVCDCVNNKMMIEIYIDDMLIDTLNCSMGFEIPLLNGQTNSTDVLNSFSFNNSNKIVIDILYKEIVNNHITTHIKNKLNTFSGFVKCEYVEYDFNISENEQNELNNILANGIYL